MVDDNLHVIISGIFVLNLESLVACVHDTLNQCRVVLFCIICILSIYVSFNNLTVSIRCEKIQPRRLLGSCSALIVEGYAIKQNSQSYWKSSVALKSVNYVGLVDAKEIPSRCDSSSLLPRCW